ncbi:MAG: flagellar export chaperone FliS [Pseudomonadota bacterium]
MFGKMTKPLDAYKAVSTDIAVQTASPHQLILMLFDGAMLAITHAKTHMEAGQIEAKGLAISKAVEIIGSGLKVSLNLEAGGQLSENLCALYDYMIVRLVRANLKNQVALLDEVASLLGDIRSAWVGITPTHTSLAQNAKSTPDVAVAA